MTFVDLVEMLRVECGVSGSKLSTVQNVSGELNRLRTWIIAAWTEMQTCRDDWKFMRRDFSINLTPNIQTYAKASIDPLLDNFKEDSVWIYDPALGVSDQMPLGEMVWSHFREMYVKGVQTPQRPMCYTIKPDDSLAFGPIPDKAYSISGEMFLLPQSLNLDTDVPMMPAKFHRCIVYEAMKKYAGYESANDVMVRATREGKPLKNALYINQLPQVTIDGGMEADG